MANDEQARMSVHPIGLTNKSDLRKVEETQWQSQVTYCSTFDHAGLSVKLLVIS